MNAESKPRQTSLRAFFDYLTLACIGLAVARWAISTGAIDNAALWMRVPLVVVTFATPFAFGAAVASLFGRRRIGVVIGVLGLLYLLFGRMPEPKPPIPDDHRPAPYSADLDVPPGDFSDINQPQDAPPPRHRNAAPPPTE